MTRRQFVCAAGCLLVPGTRLHRRSFWVLKLLNPTCLIVYPRGTDRLHCLVEGNQTIVEGRQSLRVTPDLGQVEVTGPSGSAVNCTLEIPNVIRRSYFGTFKITADAGVLIPVVTMDCETATGSIVQAELITYTAPPQALAAQAIAARSMTMAASPPRHPFADFCDTTHCQCLRSPASVGSAAADAANVTNEMVLLAGGRVLAARYSAACGGHTDSKMDGCYEYLGVDCEVCRTTHASRRGHGLGLCQEGAIGLARQGWTWRAILRKYYPNTTVGLAPQSL